MRVLALDLGTRTLGIAISKTGILSNPYTTLRYNGEKSDLIKPLEEIIKKERIDTLVLGLPKDMNNSLGFASDRSMEFKKVLEDNFNMEVVLVDERLSTTEANNILLVNDMSRSKRKGVIDSAAAMIILDTYLKMKENK